MSGSSQFLYSYIDELIKNKWAVWSEHALAKIPDKKFHVPRGFQLIVGAQGADARSRELECFKLGLSYHRVVSRSGFPEGWKQVCNGISIHTPLGYFAYIIGRALKNAPDSPQLNSALNALATLQILLIGFSYEGRWFSTVNIYDFVREEFEKKVDRSLNAKELRLLAGAVFNTLDGKHISELISAYAKNKKLPSLYYTLQKEKGGGEVELSPNNIETLSQDKAFNINTIENHKGALFWSSEERGIYSLASSDSGQKFLKKFMEVDRALAARGKIGFLNNVLKDINEQEIGHDVITVLTESIADEDADLFEDFEKIMARLESGTVNAAEHIQIKGAHPFLTLAIQHIRLTLEGEEEPVSESQNIQSISEKTKKIPPTKKEEKDLTQEELTTIANTKIDSIFVAPPSSIKRERTKQQRIVRKYDQAERDSKNRALGNKGEKFVVDIEKNKLIKAGRLDLSKKVEWTSDLLGDGAGYDILSYDANGKMIFIEVKSTRSGANSPFFISENELRTSQEKGSAYKLYRVYNIGKEPKVYILEGTLDVNLELKPVCYRAYVR